MITLTGLKTNAHQFLRERDWEQFHNPKNDAMNVMVEVGELAEFLVDGQTSVRSAIIDEMADVLFAILSFTLFAEIDVAQAVGALAKESLSDAQCSFEQLQQLIARHSVTFGSMQANQQQMVLALVAHASQLADAFVWCTTEESVAHARERHQFIMGYVAYVVADLIRLAVLLDVDAPAAFSAKMQRNAEKYPVHQSSGAEYIKIKDRSRGRTALRNSKSEVGRNK